MTLDRNPRIGSGREVFTPNYANPVEDSSTSLFHEAFGSLRDSLKEKKGKGNNDLPGKSPSSLSDLDHSASEREKSELKKKTSEKEQPKPEQLDVLPREVSPSKKDNEPSPDMPSASDPPKPEVEMVSVVRQVDDSSKEKTETEPKSLLLESIREIATYLATHSDNK